MSRTFSYKRKISVRLHPRLAEADKQGYCPLRLTACWHGQELQEYTGERVLPQRPGKNGVPEVLWNGEAGRVMKEHEDSANINARLATWEKDVTDTFNRLFDAAPFELVSKASLLAELFPAEAGPLPVPVAAPVVSRTFREVLEEWKGENRNLAKDSGSSVATG